MLTIEHRPRGRIKVSDNFELFSLYGEYHAGDMSPNYPVPATMDNAEDATIYLALSLCPYYWRDKQNPCNLCIEKWIDCLGFDTYLDW